jgi:hypothetical protein
LAPGLTTPNFFGNDSQGGARLKVFDNILNPALSADRGKFFYIAKGSIFTKLHFRRKVFGEILILKL